MIFPVLRLRSHLLILVVLIVFTLPDNLAIADEYVKQPLLVNFPGFAESPPSDPDEEDPFSEEVLEQLKYDILLNLADANKILEQCRRDHGTRPLKLGDPEKEVPANILFNNMPTSDPSPKTKENRRDQRKEAKKELATKFKKINGKGKQQKGQKIFVVSELDDGMGGRGAVSAPVIWINRAEFKTGLTTLPDGLFGPPPIGIGGPLIIHELLHNAGLKDSDHTTADGNAFNIPANNNDRGLLKSQCEILEKHFKKFGLTQPNEAQKVGFIDEPTKTHYALLTNPEPLTATPDHLGIIEYSFTGEQTLIGELSWDMKLPTGFLQVFVSVELAGFEEHLEFLISAFGGNPVEVEAYMVLKGVIIQPLEIVKVSGTGPDSPYDSALQFETQWPSPLVGATPVTTTVVTTVGDEVSNAMQIFSTTLDVVDPAPILTGIPATRNPGQILALSGGFFTPGELVRIFIGSLKVGEVIIDKDGAFSTSVSVPQLTCGDHLVEAVATDNAFAIGILTIVCSIPSLGKPGSILLIIAVLALVSWNMRRLRHLH